MSCWLGMAQGQDVAAPPMPNVVDDRQTPELAGEREAVARYMFFWTLCCSIAVQESDIQGNIKGGLTLKRILNLMPENVSAECPEEFRKVWIDPLEKIKTALNENPDWVETPEGKKQIEAMDEVMKHLAEPYGLKKMVSVSNKWLDEEVEDHGQAPPEMVLEKLLRLKNDLESGKRTVPVECLCAGAGEEAVD